VMKAGRRYAGTFFNAGGDKFELKDGKPYDGTFPCVGGAKVMLKDDGDFLISIGVKFEMKAGLLYDGIFTDAQGVIVYREGKPHDGTYTTPSGTVFVLKAGRIFYEFCRSYYGTTANGTKFEFKDGRLIRIEQAQTLPNKRQKVTE